MQAIFEVKLLYQKYSVKLVVVLLQFMNILA